MIPKIIKEFKINFKKNNKKILLIIKSGRIIN